MITIPIPPLILLELHLVALSPIGNLPHYHGPHWSAMFRKLATSLGEKTTEDSLLSLYVLPVEMGTLSYIAGETIHLGLVFPLEDVRPVENILQEFNQQKLKRGHFLPGKTIRLEQVICRVSGHIWPNEPFQPLNAEILQAEADHLCNLDEFHLHFHTPLRLTRPGKHKSHGHRYGDEEFFLGKNSQKEMIMTHFLQKIRLPFAALETSAIPSIRGGGLTWLDVAYGDAPTKTIGGIVGRLALQGPTNKNVAARLVAGQYFGIGKNGAFGFGFYTIPELDLVRSVQPLRRGVTMLGKATSVTNLEMSLNQLPNSSPGPDGVTVADLN